MIGVRVTPELVPINSFPIKADTAVEEEPDIAFDGENFMVVWSQGAFAGEHKVAAIRVSTGGVVVDSGILFGMGAHCEYRPALDFDGERYLAVWYNYNYSPYGVFGRFINTQCKPEGSKITIRVTNSSYMFEPDIAFVSDNYLVVWNEPSIQYDDNIYGQIVSRTGKLIGDVIPIATSSEHQYYPRVCSTDSLYLVVWNQNSRIYGQWVSVTGELVGVNFEISDPRIYNRDRPHVAIGESNCLVAWHENRGSNNDIYGNVGILVGLQEEYVMPIKNSSWGATIFSGPLGLPHDKNYKVYNILGRVVNTNNLRPGIYFIEIDGTIAEKIVKIR